jgi:hypothetical protein
LSVRPDTSPKRKATAMRADVTHPFAV